MGETPPVQAKQKFSTCTYRAPPKLEEHNCPTGVATLAGYNGYPPSLCNLRLI